MNRILRGGVGLKVSLVIYRLRVGRGVCLFLEDCMDFLYSGFGRELYVLW